MTLHLSSCDSGAANIWNGGAWTQRWLHVAEEEILSMGGCTRRGVVQEVWGGGSWMLNGVGLDLASCSGGLDLPSRSSEVAKIWVVTKCGLWGLVVWQPWRRQRWLCARTMRSDGGAPKFGWGGVGYVMVRPDLVVWRRRRQRVYAGTGSVWRGGIDIGFVKELQWR